MINGVSAECSYCDQFALYRIGSYEYELHACSNHEQNALSEYNIVLGSDYWRMVSRSSLGFPKPKVSQGD